MTCNSNGKSCKFYYNKADSASGLYVDGFVGCRVRISYIKLFNE